MISIIAAVAQDGAIGRGGDMPWHISGDLRYFKSVTSGHTVIMGRRTWESIGGHPLKGRCNIVVSGTLAQGEGFCVAKTLQEALQMALGDGEVFVMGGGMLYREAMPLSGRLYITRVHTVVEDADTFFPEIDPSKWAVKSQSEPHADEPGALQYEFTVYERKEK